jgi:DNA invertase Pin-like site-specific DNA recombinase
MIIGYARVSTDDHSLDAQLAALKAHSAERVFAEKESGVPKRIARLWPGQSLRSIPAMFCW